MQTYCTLIRITTILLPMLSNMAEGDENDLLQPPSWVIYTRLHMTQLLTAQKGQGLPYY